MPLRFPLQPNLHIYRQLKCTFAFFLRVRLVLLSPPRGSYFVSILLYGWYFSRRKGLCFNTFLCLGVPWESSLFQFFCMSCVSPSQGENRYFISFLLYVCCLSPGEGSLFQFLGISGASPRVSNFGSILLYAWCLFSLLGKEVCFKL